MLSKKIQGVSDRAIVLKRMKTNGDLSPIFNQKVIWVKEWIKNEATDEEWEKFLIYATGTSSDHKDGLTFVSVVNGSPLLSVHTCFGYIEMDRSFVKGHNDTKEKFIQKLIEVINIKINDMP